MHVIGNGTQIMFFDAENVLFVSIHRYENGKFFPSSPDGHESMAGVGAGKGKNINIPWPAPGVGDADYLAVFHSIIMPVANEFCPDFVIVSSGFDAAIKDPIGECHVTNVGYGQMTHMLKSLANGKLLIVLEVCI